MSNGILTQDEFTLVFESQPLELLHVRKFDSSVEQDGHRVEYCQEIEVFADGPDSLERSASRYLRATGVCTVTIDGVSYRGNRLFCTTKLREFLDANRDELDDDAVDMINRLCPKVDKWFHN